MRPLLLIIALTCSWPATVMAQPDSSLYEQVDTLIQLSRAIINKDVDKGDSLATEALTIARQLHYAIGEANARSQLGMIHFHRGNNKEAIKQYLAALKLYEQEHLQRTVPY